MNAAAINPTGWDLDNNFLHEAALRYPKPRWPISCIGAERLLPVIDAARALE
jgi:hypothetical protein